MPKTRQLLGTISQKRIKLLSLETWPCPITLIFLFFRYFSNFISLFAKLKQFQVKNAPILYYTLENSEKSSVGGGGHSILDFKGAPLSMENPACHFCARRGYTFPSFFGISSYFFQKITNNVSTERKMMWKLRGSRRNK